MSKSRSNLRLLLLIVMAQALWSGWFIYRTSFPVAGERYFSLFDDAMISMTYARNVTEGYGLEWSRHGEPVEGFTTPLWTGAMVPFQLPALPLRVRSLGVQCVSLVLLLLNTLLVWRLVRRFFLPNGGTALPAAFLSACYYPLAYWALMGMETGLQALLCTASVYLAFQIVEEGRNRAVALCFVLSLAYLTRMDMLILIVLVLAWVGWRGQFRRDDLPSWLGGVSLLLGTVVGYQIFREIYFGASLPNTYYLKLTGIALDERWIRGTAALLGFLRANFLPILLVVLGVLPRLRKRSPYLLPITLLAAYAGYVVWIGGDVWEMDLNVRANRFLAFVVPQAFVILNGLLNELSGRLNRPLTRRYLAVTVTVLLWLTWNGLWLSEKEDENWTAVGILERPLFVTSHALVLGELKELEKIAEPEATVATFWAGIPAYFSNYKMVDMLGYTDPQVARLDVRLDHGQKDPLKRYTPGHGKWNYEDLLNWRKPDVIFQVWGIEPKRQASFFRKFGYEEVQGFWVRAGASTVSKPMEIPSS